MVSSSEKSFQLNSESTQLVVLLFFTFISRSIFLYWNSAEYTDGIIQLTLFTSSEKVSFYPPFYAGLVYLLNFLGLSLETSGKLISILSSPVSLIPVYLLSKKLFNQKTALYSSLLFAVSPEVWRWQVRVMNDGLFTALFNFSVYLFFECIDRLKEKVNNSDSNSAKNLLNLFFWLLLCVGFATLTRYQGLAIVPLPMLVGIILFKKAKQEKFRFRIFNYIFLISSLIPYIVVILWIRSRGFGHFVQFSERTGATWLASLLAYLTMAEHFILFFPYILTYPIFVFFLYGLIKSEFNNRMLKHFIILFSCLFLIWLIVHAAFSSFQYRYFLPLISFFTIISGYGISKLENRKSAFALIFCFLFSLCFSLLSLYLQRDTFGDIKRSAVFLKENLKNTKCRIFSNEIWRPGIETVKIRFYSEIDNIQIYKRDKLAPSDYICLHSAYGFIDEELRFLSKRFQIEILYIDKAKIIPLLPDIMATPPYPNLTSHPAALVFKYFPQEFASVVAKLHEKPVNK